MGTQDIEVVKKHGGDVKAIIDELNKAFSDEWLAYYQYWIGSQIAEGLMRPDVQKELMEHANEELEHAGKLADRIISLGGVPVIEPKDWYKFTNCGYDAPTNPSTVELLKQNIKGEQCAIEVYKNLATFCHKKDSVTVHLAHSIMRDEVEHEQDLEDLQRDIAYLKK
ncbi:MAG: ferritin [Elusimicrobia bacterium]|nr:ferritin [Elusimicrobiota bacterium]